MVFHNSFTMPKEHSTGTGRSHIQFTFNNFLILNYCFTRFQTQNLTGNSPKHCDKMLKSHAVVTCLSHLNLNYACEKATTNGPPIIQFFCKCSELKLSRKKILLVPDRSFRLLTIRWLQYNLHYFRLILLIPSLIS